MHEDSGAFGVARDSCALDFGLYERASRDRPWPSYRLPADLVEVAGKHAIELELSFYGTEPKQRPHGSR
jgi:hypothetical protein